MDVETLLSCCSMDTWSLAHRTSQIRYHGISFPFRAHILFLVQFAHPKLKNECSTRHMCTHWALNVQIVPRQKVKTKKIPFWIHQCKESDPGPEVLRVMSEMGATQKSRYLMNAQICRQHQKNQSIKIEVFRDGADVIVIPEATMHPEDGEDVREVILNPGCIRSTSNS